MTTANLTDSEKIPSFPSWKRQEAAATKLSDTFILRDSSVAVDASRRYLIEQEVLDGSFFIPREMINSGRFAISNITVLTNADYLEFFHTINRYQGANIQHSADVSEDLLEVAKYIGVSARRIYSTFQPDKLAYTKVIFKLWFGAPPFNTKDSWYEEKQAAKIAALYRFCDLPIPSH
jgi:hypothetical protein